MVAKKSVWNLNQRDRPEIWSESNKGYKYFYKRVKDLSTFLWD